MQDNQEEPVQPSQVKKPKHTDAFFATSGSLQPSTRAPALTKANRRLDSLARLLEGGMICASAYLTSEGIVYVTTNTVYPNKKNFPRNAKTKYLQEIFLHFKSDEFNKSAVNEITEGDIRIIIKVYLEKLIADYQGNVKLMPQIDEAILRKMIIYFSREREDWLKSYNIDMHSEFLNEEDHALFTKKSTLNSQQHMKLNKKLAVIAQVLNILWGHYRDYSKFKSLTKEHALVINDYRILAIGNEKEHAELRMLSYLLNESQILANRDVLKVSSYIGISKLCCPDCICAIQTINITIQSIANSDHKSYPELKAVFDSDNIGEDDGEIGTAVTNNVLTTSITNEAIELEAAEEAQAAELSSIAVRGSHDISISKWPKPTFLCGEAYLDNDDYLVWSVSKSLQIPHETNAGWERVKARKLTSRDVEHLTQIKHIYETVQAEMNIRKKEVANSRQSMYPSPSSSDAAGSVSASPDQKRQAVSGDVFDELIPEQKDSLDYAK